MKGRVAKELARAQKLKQEAIVGKPQQNPALDIEAVTKQLIDAYKMRESRDPIQEESVVDALRAYNAKMIADGLISGPEMSIEALQEYKSVVLERLMKKGAVLIGPAVDMEKMFEGIDPKAIAEEIRHMHLFGEVTFKTLKCDDCGKDLSMPDTRDPTIIRSQCQSCMEKSPPTTLETQLEFEQLNK